MRVIIAPLFFVPCVACSLVLAAQSSTAPPATPAEAPAALQAQAGAEAVAKPTPNLVQMQAEAKHLEAWVQSAAARDFLAGLRELPAIASRTVYQQIDTRAFISAAEFAAIKDDAEKARYKPREFDYYFTGYGTPLAYTRAIDILGAHGIDSWVGRRIVDFGFGTVAHLRMLAARGADVTGIEVSSMLESLYCEPRDQGLIKTDGPTDGHVRLVYGLWPVEEAIAERVANVGGGAPGELYDVFLSKNTLKRGYVNPPAEHNVPDHFKVKLGVSDAEYLQAVSMSLKPGGLFLIYNICGAQGDLAAGEPYNPSADGLCPFSREQLEQAGFEVLAFDVDDSAKVQDMGRFFGWNEGKSHEEYAKGWFGWYTLARKKVQ